MASAVFGVPITVQTVRASGLYKEPITQKHAANLAMKQMNANGNDAQAQKFVDNLKDRYGNGISAKCLIYNATGTTLNFVTYQDLHGHIYEVPYPAAIQNGQWGAYLHVHPTGGIPGSTGAVVYRSKIPDNDDNLCDWLFSWSIPGNPFSSNKVYTEIREKDHYFKQHWDYIFDVKLDNSGRTHTDSNYGYVSQTSIGGGTTTDVRAVFQIPMLE